MTEARGIRDLVYDKGINEVGRADNWISELVRGRPATTATY